MFTSFVVGSYVRWRLWVSLKAIIDDVNIWYNGDIWKPSSQMNVYSDIRYASSITYTLGFGLVMVDFWNCVQLLDSYLGLPSGIVYIASEIVIGLLELDLAFEIVSGF